MTERPVLPRSPAARAVRHQWPTPIAPVTEAAERPALSLHGVTVRFGGLTALDDVGFDVAAGSRHGVLGPNGSGKTTLFNAISGFVRPQAGTISLRGTDLVPLPAHRRAGLGLARTFQVTSLFPSLTVGENVLLAALARSGDDRDPWRPAGDHVAANERASSLLADLGLAAHAERPVRSLGYGQQRQLELAVALAGDPTVLLLDEPTAGLSAAETAAHVALLARLPADLTILLIEHDLGVVFDLTDRLTVLANGRLIADGPTAAVRDDPTVKAVYLGS